jgi:hypothetical protein
MRWRACLVRDGTDLASKRAALFWVGIAVGSYVLRVVVLVARDGTSLGSALGDPLAVGLLTGWLVIALVTGAIASRKHTKVGGVD